MATPVQIAVTAQTQQAQAAINGLAGQFQGLFNSLKTGFGIDLAGRINQQIMRIPEALMSAARTGMSFNSVLEDSTLAFAGMLRQFEPGKFGNLEAGIKGSKVLIAELRKEAMTTTATFRDLVQATQGLMGPGLSAGIPLEKMAALSAMMARTVSAIMPGAPGMQLMQEGRAMLTGNIGPDAQVAKALGITSEQIKAATQQGRLYEFLTEKMRVFNEVADRAAGTLTGLVSNLKDAFDNAMGQAMEVSFERVKEFIQKLKGFVESDDFKKGAKAAATLGTEMVEGAGVVGTGILGPLNTLRDRYLEGVTEFSTQFFYAGNFLGAFTAPFKRFSEMNDIERQRAELAGMSLEPPEEPGSPSSAGGRSRRRQPDLNPIIAASSRDHLMTTFLQGFRAPEVGNRGLFMTAGGQAAQRELASLQQRSLTALIQIRDRLNDGLALNLDSLAI